MKIFSNKVKCLKCGDIIESTSIHDFKWCSCRNVAVDGGKEYLKRCYKTKEFQELSEYKLTEEEKKEGRDCHGD